MWKLIVSIAGISSKSVQICVRNNMIFNMYEPWNKKIRADLLCHQYNFHQTLKNREHVNLMTLL